MHMLIRAIVDGESEEEVLDKVKSRLNNCLEFFDYWTTFDQNAPMSGKARYGNIPPVVKLSSEKGQELLNAGMEATKRDFLKALRKIRQTMEEKTDEEIYNTTRLKDRFFRARASVIGRVISDAYWVYDLTEYAHFSTIENEERLPKTIDYAKEKGNTLWVVPVDVHF